MPALSRFVSNPGPSTRQWPRPKPHPVPAHLNNELSSNTTSPTTSMGPQPRPNPHPIPAPLNEGLSISHNVSWGWSRNCTQKTSHPGNTRWYRHLHHTPKLGQHTPSMADGIGDSKNRDMGLTGPKWNPLKQTSPANAREYYNSKVPGVNNQKTKTLSHSPSVEPNDHENSPTEQSIKYANPTHIQTTQDHSRETLRGQLHQQPTPDW